MEILIEWQKLNDQLKEVLILIEKIGKGQEEALKKLDKLVGYAPKPQN